MTQEERWQKRYEEVVEFIEANHQNPSKHRIDARGTGQWHQLKLRV